MLHHRFNDLTESINCVARNLIKHPEVAPFCCLLASYIGNKYPLFAVDSVKLHPVLNEREQTYIREVEFICCHVHSISGKIGILVSLWQITVITFLGYALNFTYTIK